MTDPTMILSGLGPAERLALTTRQATQQTADRLAGKKLTRHVQGPPRRAYAKATKISIDLTPLGMEVVELMTADQSL